MARTVRKTTLDLDVELLERAKDALGTRGIKDTIDRALSEAVVASARRRTIARLASMPPIDSDELRREVWER
jgi:hypothetical protein